MGELTLDKNGQLSIGFHLANNEIKAINTLYGLIMGMASDGVINEEEINFLNFWLLDNKVYTNVFPINVIKNRVDNILADGVITREELDDFNNTLAKIIGGTYQETGSPGGFSTSYGVESPDNLIIHGSTFCFTGAFVYGTREKCEQVIASFGGKSVSSVNKNLDYLIIGALASRDWVATSHGRKIEKAFHYKEKGCQITILEEETWVKFINIDS